MGHTISSPWAETANKSDIFWCCEDFSCKRVPHVQPGRWVGLIDCACQLTESCQDLNVYTVFSPSLHYICTPSIPSTALVVLIQVVHWT